jgi:peptidoglycan hydrolase-like protein with peptidoglycan-binding domain
MALMNKQDEWRHNVRKSGFNLPEVLVSYFSSSDVGFPRNNCTASGFNFGGNTHRVGRGTRTTVAITALLLGACSPQTNAERYAYLYGLRPELDTATVEDFAERQVIKVKGWSTAAGLPTLPLAGSADWRKVLDIGLVNVDKECREYIGALFWFDRARDSAKTGLTLTGAATTSAMAILNASAEAIALTAATFGLTNTLVDTGANTVLYTIDPSSVQTAIERSQIAYREEVANKRYDNQASIIAAVQGYLALCLPATIETTINRAVATATVTAVPTAPGNPVPQLTVNPITAAVPLAPTPKLTPDERIPGATSDAERNLSLTQGRQIQAALCVTEDGQFGQRTRTAIQQYRQATGRSTASPGLNQREITDLLGMQACDTDQYRNAFERFFLPTSGSIRQLQEQLQIILAKLAPTQAINVEQTGRLDEQTRQAIRALEETVGLTPATGILSFELLERI